MDSAGGRPGRIDATDSHRKNGIVGHVDRPGAATRGQHRQRATSFNVKRNGNFVHFGYVVGCHRNNIGCRTGQRRGSVFKWVGQNKLVGLVKITMKCTRKLRASWISSFGMWTGRYAGLVKFS